MFDISFERYALYNGVFAAVAHTEVMAHFDFGADSRLFFLCFSLTSVIYNPYIFYQPGPMTCNQP